MRSSDGMSRWHRLAAIFAAAAIGGCVQAHKMEDDRLVQAGFKKIEPTMAAWSTLRRALPPHRLVHSTTNGVPAVFYSDPVACKCVYVGNEDTLKRFAAVEEVDTTKFDEELSNTDYLQY